MVDIHHSSVCNAPLSFAFDWVDDYRNTTRFMFGLATFDPVPGAADQGLGSEFDGQFKTGPIKLASRVKVVEWAKGSVIRFESIKGFRTWSTWSFAAEDDERTRITVDFSYELPGGIAGKLLGKGLEPIISPAIKHSDHELRRHVEADYQAAK